jgi:hypothetical protein
MELVDIEPSPSFDIEIGPSKTQEMYQCRFCLQEDTIENLITPCNCIGTQKYVHSNCLALWRRRFERMHIHRVRCQICKGDYTVAVSGYIVRPDTAPIVRRRRHQVRDPVRRRRTRNVNNKKIIKCTILTFQLFSCLNTLITFFYFVLLSNNFLDIIFSPFITYIQFTQSVAHVLCYAYYCQDIMYVVSTSGLLCFLITKNGLLLFLFNIIHNIAIIMYAILH